MCGLAGILSSPGLSESQRGIVHAMTAAVVHRGPDSEGFWFDNEAGLGLGHRRLSIIDLSAAGHQPMTSADGRYVLVLNGEIYNFESLRARLADEGRAPPWRGHSDTEVLLEAFAAWGLDETLARVEGMFAFALWDRQARSLTLACDRFGEKPLYYGWAGRDFLFASELSALRAHPGFDTTTDTAAAAEYLRYGYVPHPRSIYAAARKVAPGEVITVTAPVAPGDVSPRAYWSPVEAARQALATPFQGSMTEAADALDALLRRVVQSRMVSDVPLGAFLSGGLDSSTMVAMMQGQSARKVRTFTIGVDDPRFNEAQEARAVAAHLGTDHTELMIQEADLLDAVPHMGRIYDEPFADSSQIPTYLVSRMARQHVTVALSGDGGDEMFGGYARHLYGPAWASLSRIPRPLRSLAAMAVKAVPTPLLGSALSALAGRLPEYSRGDPVGQRLKLVAAKWPARDQEEFLERMYRICDPGRYMAGPQAETSQTRFDSPATGFAERSMLSDVRNYLPGDLLVKVDRAAMACSLEGRAPFLDSELFAFAWSLPMEMKVGRSQGKLVLREVLGRYVPRELWDRNKKGFSAPIDRWLRGELREWAGDLLSPQALARTGLLDAGQVKRTWDEHQSGRANHATQLWTLVMFQAWAQR